MSDLQDPYSSWPFMSSSVKLILIHLCVYGTVIFHSQIWLFLELVGDLKFPCVPSKVYLQPVWVTQRPVNIEIELLRRHSLFGKVSQALVVIGMGNSRAGSWERRTSDSPRTVCGPFSTNGFQHFPKPFSENLFGLSTDYFWEKFLWKQVWTPN